jgi:ankyrin repeat protein
VIVEGKVMEKTENAVEAMFFAVEFGVGELLRWALEKGADLESRDGAGQTVLIWAASSGHRECVGTLLGAGAAVEAADESGRTALMNSARAWHVECVKALLDAGARVDVEDRERRTAIDWCEKDSECWRVLESARQARELEKVVGDARPGARKAAL